MALATRIRNKGPCEQDLLRRGCSSTSISHDRLTHLTNGEDRGVETTFPRPHGCQAAESGGGEGGGLNAQSRPGVCAPNHYAALPLGRGECW